MGQTADFRLVKSLCFRLKLYPPTLQDHYVQPRSYQFGRNCQARSSAPDDTDIAGKYLGIACRVEIDDHEVLGRRIYVVGVAFNALTKGNSGILFANSTN